MNHSLFSSFSRPNVEVSFDDPEPFFNHDEEIEAFLTPWGPQEFQKYKEEIENVKIQDNGSYLSGELKSKNKYRALTPLRQTKLTRAASITGKFSSRWK